MKIASAETGYISLSNAVLLT